MSVNFDEAIIDIEKLRDYCLNLNHPVGRHKAVYSKKTDLTSDDADELQGIIAERIRLSEYKETFSGEYGKRFYIDITIDRFNKVETVRTLWILKRDETIPRFVSCYVKN